MRDGGGLPYSRNYNRRAFDLVPPPMVQLLPARTWHLAGTIRIPAAKGFPARFRPAMSITSPPPINLLRGWPAPSLLPNAAMQSAALRVLADPSKAQPALLYGPDQGYAPLRDALAAWLANFYGAPELPERICVTGGASQNLAVILQVFADPGTTRNVWMVAPCYHLACRVFTDAGFADRLRAVPEDEEGIDIGYLERRLKEADAAPWKAVVRQSSPTCVELLR